MKLEPIIIIHGTFSAEKDWWRKDSAFATALNASLEKAGSSARCWCHLNAGEEFKWSGQNSETARRQAGMDLALVMQKLQCDPNITAFHVIAHSHGGNIFLNAVRESLLPCDKLKTVHFLGVPVLHYKKTSYWLLQGLATITYFALAATLLDALGAHVGYLAVLAAVAGLVAIAYCLHFSFSPSGTSKKSHTHPIDHYVSDHDEVFYFMAMALDMDTHTQKYVEDILPVRRFTSNHPVNSQIRLQEHQLMNDGRGVHAHNLKKSMLTGFYKINFYAKFPVLFAYQRLSNWATYRGVKNAAKVGLGDDWPPERIYRIKKTAGDFPVKVMSLGVALEKEFVRRASSYIGEAANAFYEKITQKDYHTHGNFVELVNESLNNRRFVHSQYHQNDTIRSQIAHRIAGRKQGCPPKILE